MADLNEWLKNQDLSKYRDDPQEGEIGSDFSRPKSALNSVVQSFGSVFASVPKAIGYGAVATANQFGDNPILGNPNKETAEDTTSYQIGEAIDRYFQDNFPTNRAYDDEFWASKLPSGIGSSGGFLLGGLAGAAVKAPVMLTAGTMGAASSGVGQAEDYKRTVQEQGLQVDQSKVDQAFAVGTLPGLAEGIPLAHAFSRFDKITGGVMKKAAIDGAINAGEETVQEIFSQTAGNLIASNVVAYDPERDTFEGAADAGATGGVTGFLIGSIVGALGAKVNRLKGREDDDPEGKKEVVDQILQSAEAQAQEPELKPQIAEELPLPERLRPSTKKENFNYGQKSITEMLEKRRDELATPPEMRVKGPSQLLAEARARAAAEGKDPLEQARAGAEALAGAMASFRSPVIPNPFNDNRGSPTPDPVQQRTADTVFERETAPKTGEFIPANQPSTNTMPARSFARGEPGTISQDIEGQVERLALPNQNIIYGEGPTVAGLLPSKIRKGMDGMPLVSNRSDGVGTEAQPSNIKAEIARLKHLASKKVSVGRIARKGSQTKAWTPDNKEIDLQFEVVESSSLQKSNDNAGAVNKAYPAELQPRDRTSLQSRAQITEIAGKLNPNRLGDNPEVTNGAPIVDPDTLAVIAGNGRSLALDRAYSMGDKAGYRQWLVNNAAKFGINAEEVAKMKNPVLVRNLLTPMTTADKVDMAGRANERTTLAMTPTETAQQDAQRITDEVLAEIKDGDLSLQANVPFIRKMAQSFGTTEAAGLMDTKGRANKQMIDRLTAAIVAKAYGSKGLTETVAEGVTEGRKNLVNALVELSSRFARLQRTGRYSSISGHISEAVDMLRDADSRGLSIDEYLAQQDSFSDRSEAGQVLAVFFDQFKNSKPAIVEGLESVYSELQAADDYQSSGSDMFGDYTPPTVNQIVKRKLKDEIEAARARGRNGRADTGGNSESEPRRSESSGEKNGGNKAGKRSPQAEAGSPEDFGLSIYSEEDIAAKEKAQQDAADEEAARIKQEEDRAKADQARDDFTLTGSNQSADIAAAAGQQDIFSQPEATEAPAAKPKNQPKATTQPKEKPQTKQTPTKKPDGYGKGNKVFTEDAAAKARELLRKKLGQMNTGLDPEMMMAGLTLAGYHIEAGARKFADYAKAMVDDLGDGIKPFLRGFYENVRHYPGVDNTGMSTVAEIDALEQNEQNATSEKGNVSTTGNRLEQNSPSARNEAPGDQGSARRKSMSLTDVSKIVDGLKARMPNAEVIAVASERDLPQGIRDWAEENDYLGKGSLVAVYHDGKAYVVAENSHTEQQVVESVLHEVIGHHGIQGVLGDRMDSVLDQIARDYGRDGLATKDGERITDIYGLDWNSQADRRIAAEEYIAHLAETNSNPGLLKRIIAKVRELLRQVYPSLKWTDTDIAGLLAKSRKFVEGGKAGRIGETQAAIAAQLKGDNGPGSPIYEAAKAKGLDMSKEARMERARAMGFDTGTVVYHGTNRQFSEFSTSAPKEWENSDASKNGVHFTDSEDEASGYGKNVKAVFLNMKNPAYFGTTDVHEFEKKIRERAERVIDNLKFYEIFDAKSDLKKLSKFGVEEPNLYKVDDGWTSDDSDYVFEEKEDAYRESIENQIKNIVEKAEDDISSLDELSFQFRGIGGLISSAKDSGHDGVIFDFNDQDTKSNHYVVFEPNQIRSISAAFDPDQADSPDIRAKLSSQPRARIFSQSFHDVSDATIAKPEALEPFHKRAWKTIKEDYLPESWREWRQGVFDQFHSIETLEKDRFGKLLDGKDSAYKAAARTQNLGSVMEVLMHKGALTYQNGSVEIKNGTQGLMQIFKTVSDQNLLREWETWAAAKRASRLITEGKEKNFNQAQINTVLSEVNAKPAIKAMFEHTQREWIKFNKGVLDFAEQAGLIDPAERAVWEKDDYLPFHRINQLEDEPVKAGKNQNGLTGQRSGVRKLKGGAEKISPLESMVLNTTHMIDASFKNIAMQRIADLAETSGAMTQLRGMPGLTQAEVQQQLQELGYDTGSMTAEQLGAWNTLIQRHNRQGDGVVTVSIGGKLRAYKVEDALLMRSITSLGHHGVEGIMRLFRGAKRLLTTAVTADPAFMVRNFIRDSLSTAVTVDAKIKPLIDGIRKMSGQDAEELLWRLKAAGAGGGGFYDTSPEEVRSHLSNLKKNGKVIQTAKDAWHFWQRVGAKFENSNRLAVADRILKDGGTLAEAAHEAQDVMNFTRRGDYRTIQILTEMVPFMNARIQGLERLWRGAIDSGPNGVQFRKQFWTKGAIITAATLSLLAMNWDNDDYWDLPEWDRDTYYHFFVGDEHYRLPKPFEVGAIFSTIPERMFEQMRDDADMKLLGSRMLHMFQDTFALAQVPQLFKPAYEVAANTNSFTDRPIINYALQNVRPEAQYDPFTSETMRMLADTMPDWAPEWMRSPKKLEHVFTGYFGALGGYVMDMSDFMVRDAMGLPETPTMRGRDMPILKSFYQTGVGSTKQSDLLYQYAEAANTLQGAIKKYRAEGQLETARELEKEGQSKLKVRIAINRAVARMSELNAQIKRVLNSSAPGDLKRAKVDALQLEKQRLAELTVKRYRPYFI